MAETRAALVSGANRGIGLEIARQLARLGFLTVIGARDLAKGRAAAEALVSEGLIVTAVELDVTNRDSVAGAVAETLRVFQRLDVLVNNAGVLLDGPRSENGSAVGVPAEIVRQTFETNVLGPLLLSQAVVPHMVEKSYGRIVNMSSGLGQLTEMGSGYPAYRMSKAALNAQTRTLAAELAGAGIKVNAACPGWVKTDMGGPDAPRAVEQGAETPVWLASAGDDGPTGGFFRDKKPIAW